jgi:hypothetical protein
MNNACLLKKLYVPFCFSHLIPALSANLIEENEGQVKFSMLTETFICPEYPNSHAVLTHNPRVVIKHNKILLMYRNQGERSKRLASGNCIRRLVKTVVVMNTLQDKTLPINSNLMIRSKRCNFYLPYYIVSGAKKLWNRVIPIAPDKE